MMTIIFQTVDQIKKQLLESLLSCNANFSFDNEGNRFYIKDIGTLNYNLETSGGPSLVLQFRNLDNEINISIIIVNNILKMEILETGNLQNASTHT